MKLPPSFIERTDRLLGKGNSQVLFDALGDEVPVGIRLNRLKTDLMPIGDLVDAPVAWCEHGYYLKSRPNFTFDPLFHAGLYYVQEAASMFVSEVIRRLVDSPVTMLDLCAAPGGKSTAVRQSLPEGSVLFCNEPMVHRAAVLAENISKCGHPDMVVTRNLPAAYRSSGLRFDVILCDVPCSGEGMFRKDEAAIEGWSEDHVKEMAHLQRTIIEDIWPCLSPGGLLIYSTCTFNAEENEENLQWIMANFDATLITIETDPAWGIRSSAKPELGRGVYRFIPGFTRSEGLCMAVLRKGGTPSDLPTMKHEKKRNRKDRKAASPGDVSELRKGLLSADDFVLHVLGDSLMAIPKRWFDSYEQAVDKLHVLQGGVPVACRKGTQWIPDNALALSTAFDPKAFPAVDLDERQAIAYLRKESMTLPAGTPRGYVVVTFRQHPLGFVKNIGDRANNLLPQEWRIKSTYLPDDNQNITIFP